jgi:hypothetical protein
LGTLTLLGNGSYTVTSTGTPESISLSFTGDALTGLVNAVTGGTTLRLVIVPNDAAVAATYAGFTHSTLAGPTLSLDTIPVPEPTTLGLLAAAAPIALRRRRSAM